jgi:hypothetical protein
VLNSPERRGRRLILVFNVNSTLLFGWVLKPSRRSRRLRKSRRARHPRTRRLPRKRWPKRPVWGHDMDVVYRISYDGT